MRRLAAAVIVLASYGVNALAAPPAVEDYFMAPGFAGAELSPSGRYLAIKARTNGGRIQLAVMDTASKAIKTVAGYTNVDIGNVQWVNDGRLMFNIASRRTAQNEQFQNSGLMTVGRDGGTPLKISDYETGLTVQGVSPTAFMLAGPVAQDSEYVYLGQWRYAGHGAARAGANGIDLVRVDASTGKAEPVKSPGNAYRWALDTNGEPRVVVTDDGGKSTVHIRDSAAAPWRKLLSFPGYAGVQGSIDPLLLDASGTLYVKARAGQDVLSLHAVNAATGVLDATPLVKMDGYDLLGNVIVSGNRLLGVHYATDAYGTVWFDTSAKAVQAAVDAQLPGYINVLSLPRRPETPFVLVESHSDRQPGIFWLYNSETKALSKIGARNERIDPTRQGAQEAVSIKARDGLNIPALLTLPNGGGKKLPMVVLVHDGPYQRTVWGWDEEDQFFASRGYAVLRPDFRGSIGYGLKHFEAGLGQWGRAMQDDLADAAKWAVAQGIADPKRVCIAGHGYGGYAVLMGLARDRDLYACGVAWAAITDIGIMASPVWSTLPAATGQWKQYSMHQLLGDPTGATAPDISPVMQVGRIRAPLLLAYGARDEFVPLGDAVRFRDAVTANNKQVEWIEYPEEAHGWHEPRTRFDFWKRVDAFLARNLAPR